ncbi:hypothetical protein SAMN05421666_3500 [Roseovarius nanhaiticus]|uniref:Uncharacterized protein n=1 Tax=Roseovarius nanhaiticus TaxID=573024 RepID=A0A1N7HN33_9RHOB|nr:hypothetical protein SAMN05216208_3557 [Roseovarius nanhaiticus]SIS26259.1 hypothetical protein SAMN05421666_3500 [Roseovarius nanhaiticus]
MTVFLLPFAFVLWICADLQLRGARAPAAQAIRAHPLRT